MKSSRMFVFACLVALGVSPAVTQERTVLQIELIRNGSLVAKPQLNLWPGIEGRLVLRDPGVAVTNPVLRGLNEEVVVTPTVRGDDITLVFTITSGDKKYRPTLVISKDIRGSVEWRAVDGQPLMLTFSWVQ